MSPRLAVVSLLLMACPRRTPVPAVLPRVPDAADVSVPERLDASSPHAVTDAGPSHAGLPPEPAHPAHGALAGAWRRLPRAWPGSAPVLGTWDEPPDLDGDEIPDPLAAVAWDPRVARCTASTDDRPCPAMDPDDSGGGAGEGPLRVAFIAYLSGDGGTGEPAVDGGTGAGTSRMGRLIGVRRLWQSATGMPTTRVAAFEFAEFGPGVMVRSTLASQGAHATDTLDVVDVYTGAGLDRLAGSVLHHCTHEPGHNPVRSGGVAVTVGSMAPLVWRAAESHPFSGCAVDAEDYDRALAETLARGASVRVTGTSPAGLRPNVALALAGGVFRVVDRGGAHAHTDSGVFSDPLVAGDLRVLDITRGCSADRVRYARGERRCSLTVAREDGAFPGCEDHPSPLDPRPPRVLAVVGGGDAGVARVLFTRGGSVLSVEIPGRCGHGGHDEATPWHGSIPPGLAAAPDGQRVLFASGMDLWLSLPGRRAPVLLNPPGGALPRGTVRAMGFSDPAHAAAVISEDLLQFEITVTDEGDPPAEVRVDPSELRRPLRDAL